MKQTGLFLLGMLCSMLVYAQDCKNYYFLQNNKTIELSIYNKKGKEDGKVVYKITDVKKNGGTVSSTINSSFYNNKKTEPFSNAVTRAKCTGGMMMMDMKMFIPSQQMEQVKNIDATANDVFLEYPSGMKEGDNLKDGHFAMDMSSEGGIKSSIEIDMTERKVVGKESITSPAGTWECLKITYKSRIKIKMIVGIPIKMDITEWFAPGFGVVKTQTKHGSTLITAIK
jgi:hypothetical protein